MKLRHMIALIVTGIAIQIVGIGCVTLKTLRDAIPTKPVTPTTTTTTSTTIPQTQMIPIECQKPCMCWPDKGTYNSGKREIIIPAGQYLKCELRCLLNDGSNIECGIADLVKKADAVVIIDGKLYVKCFRLPDGSNAHYIGMKQPSTSSPLVKGQGVPVGSGLLRLFFEGRK